MRCEAFTRTPTLSEWKMFRKHAHRVKYFDELHYRCLTRDEGYQITVLTPQNMDTISRHICEIATGPAKTPLFPNLHSYRAAWLSNSELIFNHVPFMGGKKLREFCIPYRMSVNDQFRHETGWTLCQNLVPVHRILSTLAVVCPNIQEVQYPTHRAGVLDEDDDHYRELCAFLMKLSKLRRLDSSSPFHAPTMNHLSSLPDLQHLSLNGTVGQIPTPDALTILRTPYFASLRNLRLSMTDTNDAMALFVERFQGSRTLRAMEFVQQTLTNNAALVTLFIAVSRISCIEAIGWSFSCTEDSEGLHLTSRIFSLLYPLRALRELRLQGLQRVYLDDEDLKIIASAWPHLETISLRLAYHIPDIENLEPCISLGGVAALYQACPRLSFMQLDM